MHPANTRGAVRVRSGWRVVFAAATITLIFVSTLANGGMASNYGGRRVQSTSGKVMINFFSNYDYFSRELPFRYVHEVEGLDFVRLSLVQDRVIQNLPIVIWAPITSDMPMKPPRLTRFSIEDNSWAISPMGTSWHSSCRCRSSPWRKEMSRFRTFRR